MNHEGLFSEKWMVMLGIRKFQAFYPSFQGNGGFVSLA